MNDIINISIPKEPKYISVARLAISGVSMGIGFDIDSIEDLKVSLAEACINALKLTQKEKLDIEIQVDEGKITIRVQEVKESEEKDLVMGTLIINSLMDEVSYHDYGIEMIKYLKAGSNE